MDKWQKLKGFLTDGKEHITKDFYVSRPSVFEEILDIMEELEKRELSELKGKTMTDTERIEKLEKENEIMKKVLVMFISNLNQNGELINFDLKNKEVLEKLLGQLIL